MKATAYIATLGLAAASMFVAFTPLRAAPTDLADFCPDYSAPPACESAVALFLDGKPHDSAIIAAVNAIVEQAHKHRPSGRACADVEAGLTALGDAMRDAGSRSLVLGFATGLCSSGGTATAAALFEAEPTAGFQPHCDHTSGGTSGGASSSGSSGQTSSGASSGTSGQTSGGTSGGASC
jgi:hypothetical protein